VLDRAGLQFLAAAGRAVGLGVCRSHSETGIEHSLQAGRGNVRGSCKNNTQWR